MRLVYVLSALVGLSTAAKPSDQHFIHAKQNGVAASTSPARVTRDIMPMDKCLAGIIENRTVASKAIPGAVATTSHEANKLMSRWVSKARSARPECFTDSVDGTSDLMEISALSGIVSTSWQIEFQTAAKVASQTAEEWMKCRFNGARGPRAEADYLRVMFVREPAGRAISGFYQMVSHYTFNFKLPPKIARTCSSAFPPTMTPDEQLNTVVTVSGGGCSVGSAPGSASGASALPKDCSDAWKWSGMPDSLPTSPFASNIAPPGMCTVQGMTLNMTTQTAESSLLAGLWELPARCRLAGNHSLERDGSFNMYSNQSWSDIVAGGVPSWMCADDADCDAPCELSDQELANLFAHALSDQAAAKGIGCDGETYGGEHMWDQMLHLDPAARADVVLRLEELEDDIDRFEKMLQDLRGRQLPEPTEECSIENISINAGEDWTSTVSQVQPTLYDPKRLMAILDRSPDLQRRVCAVYYMDFVCLGYDLLDACTGHPSEWLDDAMDAALSDAPIKKLAPPAKKAQPHHE